MWDLSILTGKQKQRYFIVCTLGLFCWYLLVGRVALLSNWQWTTHQLPSFLDHAVPFSAPWIVLYAYMYPQTAAPLFSLQHKRTMHRWLLGILIVYCISTPIWLLYPVVRPENALDATNAFEFWVRVIYFLDPASNCFPSMHVALSLYGAWTVQSMDKKLGNLLLLGVLGIWYSTLALKQHWFVDGAVGIALVLVVDFFLCQKIPWLPEEKSHIPRKYHLYWFLPVVLVELFSFVGTTIFWEELLPYLPN